MSLPTKSQLYRYNSSSIKKNSENVTSYHQAVNIYGKSVNPQDYITLNIKDNLNNQDLTTNNINNETEADLKLNNISSEIINNLNNLQVNNNNNNIKNDIIQKSVMQKPQQYLNYNNIANNAYPLSDNLRPNFSSQDKYLPKINVNRNLPNYPNPIINNQIGDNKVQNAVPIQNYEIININNLKYDKKTGIISKKKCNCNWRKCRRISLIILKMIVAIIFFILCLIILALGSGGSSGSSGSGESGSYSHGHGGSYRTGGACIFCCCSDICKWIFKEDDCNCNCCR